ncbi:unnamed protein product, partial [marine sediment metagenome]
MFLKFLYALRKIEVLKYIYKFKLKIKKIFK